ncbi:MAG TPA: TROVE domain-containing protein [Acidimicrobiales bacterium]|nr:TROVE domain-containing protein [Acidimicrobiales bacterium]
MTTDPLTRISTRFTPQRERTPGRTDEIKNNAGGYVFGVNKWQRLNRFLILGTTGGSYYMSEPKLTKENADVVFECLAEDPTRTLGLIEQISVDGRAPKQNATIFALAVAASDANPVTRRRALELMPKVCRIGTHLFMFVGYVEQFRGWGRGLRSAVADWYLERTPDQVAYQTTKYAQRGGWSHRDLLRLAKPRPERGSDMDRVLGHVVGKVEARNAGGYIAATDAVKQFRPGMDLKALGYLIEHYNLPWEVLPSELLRDPKVWEYLVPHMGLTALIRNLGRLTDIGYIGPMSTGERLVVERLGAATELLKARVHPLQILTAEGTYRTGKGLKGSLSWTPNSAILDALDTAFYESFGNVEPANKRTLIGLDVSGSMDWGTIAGSPLTPREAGAALAMLWMRTEPQVATMAFSHELIHLPISKSMSLPDVVAMTKQIRFGGTDCALPMQWALEHNVEVDTFVVITDSETWAGNTMHPAQAIQEYRRRMGIDAKLVVVGMVSNGFTIADPKDAGMLDVVGFDTATPDVIAGFSRGDF